MSKIKIGIKTFGGRVLFEYESENNTAKKTLTEAVNKKADLTGAYLRGADLTGADLTGAYLRGADLTGADLRGAYLRGAGLRGADLRGADRNGYKLKKTPIQLLGLRYFIIIFDKHMEIGCESHTFKEWEKFKPKDITKMDGADASKFWKKNKPILMDLCKQMGSK